MDPQRSEDIRHRAGVRAELGRLCWMDPQRSEDTRDGAGVRVELGEEMS
ncbi:hypothetical protein [Nonomuraea cavernae]|nr:hypothetical protein [Nonomuraea cavernae]MCA2188194.1 hypothetical protein [Nonomuraea cavernae]